jgi:hypothetical protein
VFGVLGRHPFGGALDELVRGEKVHGRQAQVTYFTDWRQATNCHVLFVSGSEWRNLDRILASTRGRPILTVSDLDAFGQRGGVIEFVTTARVRFRVNLEAARQGQMTVSSRLLRLAESVDPPRS